MFVSAFLAEMSQSDAVPFSVHHIRKHVLLVCPITGDIDFDPLDKVMSTRFLHCKVTIFPYAINK